MKKAEQQLMSPDFFGMFDMHLHILPGIDDGAENMDETKQMISMQLAQGVSFLCATPHFNLQAPLNREMLFLSYEQVTTMMKADFPQMQLYLGEELYYSPGILQAVQQGDALTLNCSRYILLEFAPTAPFKTVYDGVQSFVRSGYIPILAHVERLSCLWRNRSCMDELKKLYIPFQMNTSSLIGKDVGAVRYCRHLVKDGYIDLLGTDAHSPDPNWRPPDYYKAAGWIFKSCGRETWERLTVKNPSAVLCDELLYF